MKDVFEIKNHQYNFWRHVCLQHRNLNTVMYATESIAFLGAEIWNLVPKKIYLFIWFIYLFYLCIYLFAHFVVDIKGTNPWPNYKDKFLHSRFNHQPLKVTIRAFSRATAFAFSWRLQITIRAISNTTKYTFSFSNILYIYPPLVGRTPS